jgi:uncharacterized protein (TIGR03435 family)
VKRVVSAVMIPATLGLIFTAHMQGQTGTPAPRFEAASLKIYAGDSMGWSISGRAPGQQMLSHIPLRDCLKLAFGLQDFSLDGPAWLNSVRVDIVAKPPTGSAPSQFNLMLQTLLVERFNIKLHWQTKSLNGFALVQESGGIKIHADENPEDGKGASGYSRGSVLWANSAGTAKLADMLSRELNAPVQDSTGNTQVFDYRIALAPERPSVITAASEPIASDPGLSLASALKEQLNLKLEKRKVPVSVLVIDKIERTPLEN